MKLSLFSLAALLAITLSVQAQSDEVYKTIAKEKLHFDVGRCPCCKQVR